jgi:dTMP kinase
MILKKRKKSKLQGKLIVFEGTDGSGKETQFRLFISLLKKRHIPFKTFDFPQYTKTFGGQALRMILNGEIDIDPTKYPIKGLSLYYSIDRGEVAPEIWKALKQNYVVVLNRYTTSNRGHQTWKYKTKKEQQDYLDWLDEIEHKQFNIPKEDLVIFFNLGIDNIFKLINSRKRANDKLEENFKYMNGSLSMYRRLARDNKHWTTIECEDDTGALLPIKEIHKQTIKAIVKIIQ